MNGKKFMFAFNIESEKRRKHGYFESNTWEKIEAHENKSNTLKIIFIEKFATNIIILLNLQDLGLFPFTPALINWLRQWNNIRTLEIHFSYTQI